MNFDLQNALFALGFCGMFIFGFLGIVTFAVCMETHDRFDATKQGKRATAFFFGVALLFLVVSILMMGGFKPDGCG